MSTSRRVDYIIVGQGLAGSAVAVQLLRAGKEILVIDEPGANKASLVAAGLFNPITGKKMTRTWMADTIFPYLQKFYSDVEDKTGKKFFHPMPIYRPFLNVEEQNDWMARSGEAHYQAYVAGVFNRSQVPGVNDAVGGLLLNQCGYLDTNEFILAVRSWVLSEGHFLEEQFDSEDLHVHSDEVSYREWIAGRVIFCTGVAKEKWFGWIPINPLKGETLSISTSLESSYIVNRGVYIVPTKKRAIFKVGATYDFHSATAGISAAGRMELEEKLKAAVNASYNVEGQEWGFRPTVPDRRPILGLHPAHDNVVVFNGLGTKGVSLAPYFSHVLIRALENGERLDNGTDLNRYKSVYWSVRKQV